MNRIFQIALLFSACFFFDTIDAFCATAVKEPPDKKPVKVAVPLSALNQWFANGGDMPKAIQQMEPMSKAQTEIAVGAAWGYYEKAMAKKGNNQILPTPVDLTKLKGNPVFGRVDPKIDLTAHKLDLGKKKMPFVFLDNGAPKKGKRPLFITLHGGGSSGGRARTPHGWPTNTREWKAQIFLTRKMYPKGALYFVPRMADDNDGRWYYNYCQDAYRTVIQNAILFHNVDPNRVYLIGISEGAYTAYRLGAFMADRFAGSGSMAGGEPTRNAPPENMRNIAFRADIGEFDTMFNRLKLNKQYGDALKKLQKNDPKGYKHLIQVHQRRGHGIDYKPCPQWLVKEKRNPYPSRITWKVINVHGRYKKQFYWLALEGNNTTAPSAVPLLFDAKIDKKTNSVTVTVKKFNKTRKQLEAASNIPFRVYLNDTMLDLDRPVKIVRNGKVVFNGKVKREWKTLARTLTERGDLRYTFPAEVIVK